MNICNKCNYMKDKAILIQWGCPQKDVISYVDKIEYPIYSLCCDCLTDELSSEDKPDNELLCPLCGNPSTFIEEGIIDSETRVDFWFCEKCKSSISKLQEQKNDS